MSFFLARRRVFSGLKGVKVVQIVIPSRCNSCVGIFMYLKKAFDTVNHDILVTKT